MKVSARNAFEGTVDVVRPGVVNAEVDIALGGGDRLVAVVAMESVRALELAPGKAVVALVKAPWVLLATGGDGRGSARNRLRGTVKSVAPGAVNAEVTLVLAGGAEVAAVVSREAVVELGLRPGVLASALIKASDVVLALPA